MRNKKNHSPRISGEWQENSTKIRIFKMIISEEGYRTYLQDYLFLVHHKKESSAQKVQGKWHVNIRLWENSPTTLHQLQKKRFYDQIEEIHIGLKAVDKNNDEKESSELTFLIESIHAEFDLYKEDLSEGKKMSDEEILSCIHTKIRAICEEQKNTILKLENALKDLLNSQQEYETIFQKILNFNAELDNNEQDFVRFPKFKEKGAQPEESYMEIENTKTKDLRTEKVDKETFLSEMKVILTGNKRG